ncbi:Protein SDA1-like protein [Plecturocebus cupreus]
MAGNLLVQYATGKKSSKNKKMLEKAMKVFKKQKKKKKPGVFNFSAVHLIHDHQDFAEKLLKQLECCQERSEVKMLVNLISRLVGIQELFPFNFSPFLQRFLQPRQREVTKILLFTAQASHHPRDYSIIAHDCGQQFCYQQELWRSHDSRNQCYKTEARVQEYGEGDAKDYIPGGEVLEVEKEENTGHDEDGRESTSLHEEEDANGKWVDVQHSSDEEQLEISEKLNSMTREEEKGEAAAISNSRALTQEDFQKIRLAQMRKELDAGPGKSQKRKYIEIDSDKEPRGKLLSLWDTERLH